MSNEVFSSLTIEIMQSDWSKSHEYFLPIRVHNLSLAMLKFVYDSRSFWLMPTFQRHSNQLFRFSLTTTDWTIGTEDSPEASRVGKVC